MSTREYKELMKSILRMQIDYITEDPEYDGSEYLQGQEQGLLTAILKLEQSDFLCHD